MRDDIKSPTPPNSLITNKHCAPHFARIIPDTRPSGSLRSRQSIHGTPGDFFSMCFGFSIHHHPPTVIARRIFVVRQGARGARE